MDGDVLSVISDESSLSIPVNQYQGIYNGTLLRRYTMEGHPLWKKHYILLTKRKELILYKNQMSFSNNDKPIGVIYLNSDIQLQVPAPDCDGFENTFSVVISKVVNGVLKVKTCTFACKEKVESERWISLLKEIMFADNEDEIDPEIYIKECIEETNEFSLPIQIEEENIQNPIQKTLESKQKTLNEPQIYSGRSIIRSNRPQLSNFSLHNNQSYHNSSMDQNIDDDIDRISIFSASSSQNRFSNITPYLPLYHPRLESISSTDSDNDSIENDIPQNSFPQPTQNINHYSDNIPNVVQSEIVSTNNTTTVSTPFLPSQMNQYNLNPSKTSGNPYINSIMRSSSNTQDLHSDEINQTLNPSYSNTSPSSSIVSSTQQNSFNSIIPNSHHSTTSLPPPSIYSQSKSLQNIPSFIPSINNSELLNNNQQINNNQSFNNNQQINDNQPINNNQSFNNNQQINNNQSFNNNKPINNNQSFNNNQQINNNKPINNIQLLNDNGSLPSPTESELPPIPPPRHFSFSSQSTDSSKDSISPSSQGRHRYSNRINNLYVSYNPNDDPNNTINQNSIDNKEFGEEKQKYNNINRDNNQDSQLTNKNTNKSICKEELSQSKDHITSSVSLPFNKNTSIRSIFSAPPSRNSTSNVLFDTIDIDTNHENYESDLVSLFDKYNKPLYNLFILYASRVDVSSPSTKEISKENMTHSPTMPADNYLWLCRDFEIVPYFLTEGDIGGILSKSITVKRETKRDLKEELDYGGFIDCLSRCALILYSSPLFQYLYPSPGIKISVFLEMWGLVNPQEIDRVSTKHKLIGDPKDV
ncbi:hypothetical protein WA158_007704 [Blastocystis sp. Blastoise]